MHMNRTVFYFFLISLLALTTACKQVAPPAPVGPLPSEAQLKWHQMEYYAFVHFNMNTFTDEEWGFGNEDPASFNPTELDCNQWVKLFKEAGMKGVIITAKHHDGFCLWPTSTTEHSIKNSPYKDGQGDIIKELAEACRAHGLKMGVYLSPWDRNNEHYGTPEYIGIFREQLRELLSNYGDIFEVWFDGANGGTGYYGGANENRKIDRKTYYDWENTYKIIRELQPDACIFGDGGPEVRWVGNEEGWAGETNWSIIRQKDCYAGMPNHRQLQYGHEDGTHWVPAEVDVSIRPGWYYHTREDHRVKSLNHLVDIYYQSVGRNASLLLNFPVDRRGLVHENDAQRVLDLAQILKEDFAHNLAPKATASASEVRGNNRQYAAQNAIDLDASTYWTTNDSTLTASISFEYKTPITFNRFLVQEYIPLGQRVKAFKVEALVNDEWKVLDEQTTIGAKRILRLPTTTSSQIRLSITDSKACPLISNIEIYNAPKLLTPPVITRDQQGTVTIAQADDESQVFYTTDGSEPNQTSMPYVQPFTATSKQIVKAIALDSQTDRSSSVSEKHFDVAPIHWKVMNSEDEHATAIFDGNSNTAWYVKGKQLPLELIIDLGEELPLTGFTYLPDQGRWAAGYAFNYELYVSTDGRQWGLPVSQGEFSNIVNSPVLQTKNFELTQGRFIKLKVLSVERGSNQFGIAEFTVLTE